MYIWVAVKITQLSWYFLLGVSDIPNDPDLSAMDECRFLKFYSVLYKTCPKFSSWVPSTNFGYFQGYEHLYSIKFCQVKKLDSAHLYWTLANCFTYRHGDRLCDSLWPMRRQQKQFHTSYGFKGIQTQQFHRHLTDCIHALKGPSQQCHPTTSSILLT